MGPPQGTKARLAAPSALTLQTRTWPTAQHSPGDRFPPVRDTKPAISHSSGGDNMTQLLPTLSSEGSFTLQGPRLPPLSTPTKPLD